ncbi:MAG: 4a-hydroxytetrahydrobiopterin dehydratase [Candidatus Thalassarchaeaceae archaeon]|jgi:4a-hydroxytetrahydrobiopterin dehydratase|nr:4a-hydroxytetrahydrobiopterin dehydratase [Candidatus Thalassarchaeaceae archaeon]MDP6702968.1 4a-hydroxytetrahydrobiopterin dehydratase [Candidatus Thalassarchaeaceae archaeon]MDP7004254.1 4a-hydroxytetrahydrobiopterin dehydratase [Candidatus Thalassarchaeaceae archaeon]
MSSLAERECVACKGSVPPLSEDESAELSEHLQEGWQVIDNHHLARSWKFPDFASAMGFTNSLGVICEQQNHHADFELGWGRVRAVIYTHKIDGLTESDFVLAAKFDRL